MAVVFEKTKGLTDAKLHYCPGCGHGIVHRLVAEVLEEMGELGNSIVCVPVGCAVFANNYFNIDAIQCAHGRAPATATGIKRVRPDGKIDLTLQKKGKAGVRDFADILQEYMEDHGGVCTLCDKSPADEIYQTFGVSKKIFKKGIGDLYKRRLIEIGENCLILIRALD